MGYKMEDQLHQIDEEIGCRVSNLVDPYLGGHQTWREKDNLGMRGFIKTPSGPHLFTMRGCFELLENEKNTSFCGV
jgi:hypothetical protein